MTSGHQFWGDNDTWVSSNIVIQTNIQIPVGGLIVVRVAMAVGRAGSPDGTLPAARKWALRGEISARGAVGLHGGRELAAIGYGLTEVKITQPQRTPETTQHRYIQPEHYITV